MTSEDPTVAIARFDERLEALGKQLAQVRSEMATREGQDNSNRLIERLERALALEVENRIKADLEERSAREKGDLEEKTERQALADRFQLVEDRQENRKYMILAAILLSAIGLGFSIIQAAVNAGVNP